MAVRAYNAKTVAFAVGATPKWLDNLLSRHRLPGVTQSRQGVERQISDEGLLAIELTRLLVWEFGIPLPQSAAIVRTVLRTRPDVRDDHGARFEAPSGVALLFPLHRIQERLRIQLLTAIEAVPNVARGRPRRDRP